MRMISGSIQSCESHAAVGEVVSCTGCALAETLVRNSSGGRLDRECTLAINCPLGDMVTSCAPLTCVMRRAAPPLTGIR